MHPRLESGWRESVPSLSCARNPPTPPGSTAAGKPGARNPAASQIERCSCASAQGERTLFHGAFLALPALLSLQRGLHTRGASGSRCSLLLQQRSLAVRPECVQCCSARCTFSVPPPYSTLTAVGGASGPHRSTFLGLNLALFRDRLNSADSLHPPA